jgi:hypothetical protein
VPQPVLQVRLRGRAWKQRRGRGTLKVSFRVGSEVYSCLPSPPVTHKIPAYPLKPQDAASSGSEAQGYLEDGFVKYATSATSAASFRKLFLPLFFTGVFPKLPAVLASLTYPRASVLYSGHCHCPWMKDFQVLQSLLIPQVASYPWSAIGARIERNLLHNIR